LNGQNGSHRYSFSPRDQEEYCEAKEPEDRTSKVAHRRAQKEAAGWQALQAKPIEGDVICIDFLNLDSADTQQGHNHARCAVQEKFEDEEVKDIETTPAAASNARPIFFIVDPCRSRMGAFASQSCCFLSKDASPVKNVG
jgi:hypothetical protein